MSWSAKPNEPERQGIQTNPSAADLRAGLPLWRHALTKPERAAVSEGAQRVAAFPNEPEVSAFQTNPSRARYPNEPERGEIQTLHTIVLVGGGALSW